MSVQPKPTVPVLAVVEDCVNFIFEKQRKPRDNHSNPLGIESFQAEHCAYIVSAQTERFEFQPDLQLVEDQLHPFYKIVFDPRLLPRLIEEIIERTHIRASNRAGLKYEDQRDKDRELEAARAVLRLWFDPEQVTDLQLDEAIKNYEASKNQDVVPVDLEFNEPNISSDESTVPPIGLHLTEG